MIIYLHGFNGSSASNTAVGLKKVFGDEIQCLDYDFIHPDIAFSQIESVIKNSLSEQDEPILVGTSLGGFWANYFGNKYGLRVVLINPSLIPHVTLKEYVGKQTPISFEDVASYEPFANQFFQNLNPFKIVFSGENDKIVPTQRLKEHFPKLEVQVLPEEGHRISNIEPIVKAINFAQYSIYE